MTDRHHPATPEEVAALRADRDEWESAAQSFAVEIQIIDRTAAEVMCCPDGCDADTRSHKTCCAGGLTRVVENLHTAGYMIVPRYPTDAMWKAAMDREGCDDDVDAYNDIYRAMTAEGELK